jgi:TolB-like protein
LNIKSMLTNFFSELRRRRVIKASVAYLLVAWVLIETTAVIFPAILLPEWAHRFVVVLAGVGLPVVLALAWVFDVSADGIKYTENVSKDSTPGDGLPGDQARVPALVPPPAESAISSICVLPFEVLSSDPEDRFIAQGVCAELCSALTKLAGVRVVSRISTSTLEEGLDVREIGARFSAQYILAASFSRHGDKIRIIVELTDLSSGSQLWSETYQRVLDDIMEVEQDIAGAIAGSFGGERLREQTRQARETETMSATAWTLVHKARSFVLNYSEENLKQAASLARQAVELDSNYAAAHAALADAIGERITNGLCDDPETELEEAISAIGVAIEKMPDDVFVLKLAGNVWKLAGDYDRAIDCLKRAVEISPFDLGAWGYLASALATSENSSQLQEAENILDRILESAPQHPGAGFWWHHKALVCTSRGDFDGAVSCVSKALQKQPGYAWAWFLKANALASIGDETGAREALARGQSANKNLSFRDFAAIVKKTSATDEAAERRLAGLISIGLD